MKSILMALVCALGATQASAQRAQEWLANLAQPRDYVQKRASSYDRSGGNTDYRRIAPHDTLVLMDESGPGEIMHIWTTMWHRVTRR